MSIRCPSRWNAGIRVEGRRWTSELWLNRFLHTELVARLSRVGLKVASGWLHVRGNQQELAPGLFVKRATTSESRTSRLNWRSR
jgi:hypothetical protein